MHLYLLNPQPRQTLWDSEHQPHVLVVQNPVRQQRSVHIATLDPSLASGTFQGGIHTIPTRITRFDTLEAVDLAQICLPGHIDCMVWWGEHELCEAHDLVVQHGFSFFIIRNHLAAVQSSAALPSSLATPHGLTDSDDSMSLPQEMTVLGKVQIELDLLLSSFTTTTPVKLLAGTEMDPLPRIIECEAPPTATAIHDELLHWGHVL